MEPLEIIAAGVFADDWGERWLVLEYSDGSCEAYVSLWFDNDDREAIWDDDNNVIREWLRRIQREGVADWTIEPDIGMAHRILGRYEGIGICGIGEGWE